MNRKKKAAIALIVLGAFASGLLVSQTDLSLEEKAKVAVIPVRGTILPNARQASPSYLSEQIEKAEKDDADAFLFQINSPGGTVVASRQMEKMIERVEKPTVCQIKDLGASGAYWVASACDSIVADPLSVTGSIGVSSSYLEYSEYMKEEGIEYVRLAKGKFKDMGSSYRNITEREREIFNQSLEKVYNYFIESVASNRALNKSETKELATGRTFLGTEAKGKGLVDYLGGKRKAKEVLRQRLDKEVKLNKYRRKVGVSDLLNLFGKQKSSPKTLWKKFINSLETRTPYFFAI